MLTMNQQLLISILLGVFQDETGLIEYAISYKNMLVLLKVKQYKTNGKN